MKLLFIVIALLISINANAGVLFDPQLTFGSKMWQTPKPYVGIGITFSNISPSSGTNESFQSSFFTGLTQFQNLTVHIGMRFNGFLAAELAYARIFKNIPSPEGAHNFTADLIMLKGMLFPLSMDFGPIASAELFLTAGAAFFATMNSNYVNSAGVRVGDNTNNTFNLLYGGGLQIGFARYVALRFELDVLSPINGQPFGPSPYSNVMLLYNLTISFYPF